jgi:hypothetical protein
MNSHLINPSDFWDTPNEPIWAHFSCQRIELTGVIESRVWRRL